MKASLFRTACLVLSLAGLAACKPKPPPTDEPPEPKAVTATASNTELRDAIQKPIDQAKAVEGTVQEAADKQNAEIDAATQ
jgi:hypothetical protein